MNTKKIVWVTPDCFVDCDIDIIHQISNNGFSIYWIVLLSKGCSRFKESDFEEIEHRNVNVSIEFLYQKYRKRYPQNFLYYLKIKNIIKRESPDLIYFNVIPSDPYIMPLYLWLPQNKTIVTAHDGRVTASMGFNRILNYCFKKAFMSVKYVNMFSNYQAGFFQKNYPGRDVIIIPLALKDFGRPTVSRRKDAIGFVFFGTVHFEKNLELLIEAADQLYEDGVRGFKVSINGGWRVVWKPEDKIRHPEIFELNIGTVPNSEIPNIFTYNHYSVFPYKNMSQSGAIKCSFNYNTPVIVSNLPGFTDEVIEGVDGFSFKSEDVDDLKRVMIECINRTSLEYSELTHRMEVDIKERYSIESIKNLYINMFNKVLER